MPFFALFLTGRLVRTHFFCGLKKTILALCLPEVNILLGWSVYILATLPPPHRKHDSDYLPESPETQNSSLPQAANQQSMATWGGPFGSVCMSVGIWAWSVHVSGRPLKVLPIESLAKRLEQTLPNTHTVVSGLPYPLDGRSLHFVVINYNWATRVVLLFAGIQAYPLPHYNSRIRNEVIILLDASQTAGLMKRTYMMSDCEGVHSVVPRVVYNIMTTLLLFLCFGLVSVVLRDAIQTVEMSIGN